LAKQPSRTLGAYDRWTRNQAVFAKAAADMGLAERRLELDESQARTIVAVIEATLTELGVSFTDPRVPAIVAQNLRAIETTATAR
jgi:hypothetical protein